MRIKIAMERLPCFAYALHELALRECANANNYTNGVENNFGKQSFSCFAWSFQYLNGQQAIVSGQKQREILSY